jgi:signal transduction histidine kinase/DNA-binding response OmpR family regulator
MKYPTTPNKVSHFRSINTKMSLIMAAILFVCMAGMVAFFLIDNLKRSVEAERQRLISMGSVYRAVLSEPVSRSDKTATREVLRSLRDIASLRQAAVHNATAELLGEMGGGAVLERTVLNSNEFGVGEILTKKTVRIESEIMHGGIKVGSLRLIADISWVIAQFWLQVSIAIVAAAIAITVALVVGNMLIRRASKRLSALATGLADIGTKETLAYKFTRQSNDEVGILVDAFNDMMGRISERDQALRTYNENLEQTVSERTSELVIARDEAESANAAKSEFLAMMSHEIRTPMNGMMVMAQMLAAAPLSPRHLRFAEIINRSGQNLLSIINDVLDISKIEAGKLVIEASPFSIDDILADIHGLFHERAREKSISISFSVDPSVPEVLIGDATRLNQVITNLVNNALKFTEKGGVKIHASTRQVAQGLMLHISVTDTGIGIAADKLAIVFERFAQADQSITRRFGGTGLGLAISRRLVESMGGEISVQSREGAGSTFSFDIAVASEAIPVSATSFNGTKIKVSMSDNIQSESLSDALNSFGAKTTSDTQADTFDILLSDNAEIVDQSSQTALFLEPVIDAGVTGYRGRGRLVLTVPATRNQLRKLADAVAAQDFTSFRAMNKTADRLQNFTMFRGLRALAVDDNTVNREVLVEALSSMGIEADTAVNGQDALAKAASKLYDIIFMDCSMPVMDGYTATRILRDREKGTSKRIPIVAITALTEKAGKDDWRSAGMDSWISKPFTIPAVAERITALVLKHTATSSDQGGLSQAEQFSSKFESVPLLDEQTVSMIARIGSHGTEPATRKILQLFVSNATAAIEQLRQAARDQQTEQMVVIAHNLRSISQSAGAARLSAIAADLEVNLKSGLSADELIFELLQRTYQISQHELAARFGLPLLQRAG